MSIHSENLVLITTTMAGNEIAERRRKMMVDTMSAFRIPVFLDHGVTEIGGSLIDKQYRIMKSRMEQFMKMPGFEYAVLCDDDFHCGVDFLVELNRTVSVLPQDWRCLHLCPGCLWGRSIFREKGKGEDFQVGELVPERGMGILNGLEVDASGRYFKGCGSGLWNGKYLWLGGPIAVLVRRGESIASLWEDFTRLYVHENNPNDVILTNILKDCDFVCRSPLLGYEDEMGGTCFQGF
jgi:hypothetical protein